MKEKNNNFDDIYTIKVNNERTLLSLFEQLSEENKKIFVNQIAEEIEKNKNIYLTEYVTNAEIKKTRY